MERAEAEVAVDTNLLHREILDLKAAVENLDNSIRGDTVNDPGIIGRLRIVEEWKRSREAFERKVLGTLITMAVTGIGTMVIAFLRLTGNRP